MLIIEFARRLASLPEITPWQVKLDDALKRGSRYQNKWYRTEKEHMLGWLGDYHTPGAYERKTTSPTSAKAVYNRLNHAPSLMWMAEAVGIPEAKLAEAFERVRAAGKASTAQAGAFRRVVDWDQISARISEVDLSQEQIEFSDRVIADAVVRLRELSPLYRNRRSQR